MSITDFLLDLFREEKEYSTVNLYQSAISVFHPGIDGNQCRQSIGPEVAGFEFLGFPSEGVRFEVAGLSKTR